MGFVDLRADLLALLAGAFIVTSQGSILAMTRQKKKRGRRVAVSASDAEALDCANEVCHAQEILAQGTSAQTQVRKYDEELAAGKDKQSGRLADRRNSLRSVKYL